MGACGLRSDALGLVGLTRAPLAARRSRFGGRVVFPDAQRQTTFGGRRTR